MGQVKLAVPAAAIPTPIGKEEKEDANDINNWEKKKVTRWTCLEVKYFVAQVGEASHWDDYADACLEEKVDGSALDAIGDNHTLAIELGFPKLHAIVLSKAIRKAKNSPKAYFAKEEIQADRKEEKLQAAPHQVNLRTERKATEKNQADLDRVESDRKLAEDLRSAEAEAEFLLAEGVSYQYGSNWKVVDKEKGKKLTIVAMKKGNTVAMGRCYYYGWGGLSQDATEAILRFRLAGDEGHAGAQCALGSCYMSGKGAAKDYKEAVVWYTKAAENGNVGAQFNLGVCYLNGHGVSKDMKEAVHWFRAAARQGHSQAQFSLGLSYRHGDGVVMDEIEAVELYRLAAEQGIEMPSSTWVFATTMVEAWCTMRRRL